MLPVTRLAATIKYQTCESNFSFTSIESKESGNTWSLNTKMPRQPLVDRTNKLSIAPTTDKGGRESFDDIYLDISRKSGKCRIAESGLGWKPSSGDTFTLDKAECVSAQWSRAARGYELKIFTRNDRVVQLDGFRQEVSEHVRIPLDDELMRSRTMKRYRSASKYGTASN